MATCCFVSRTRAFEGALSLFLFSRSLRFRHGRRDVLRRLAVGRFLCQSQNLQPFGLGALGQNGGLIFRRGRSTLADLDLFLVERGLGAFHVGVFVHEQPVVLPQVSHFMQVPLRTSVKLPHSPQASPS